MSELSIEDIQPKRSFFELKVTGRRYHLHPVMLEDEIWLRHEFGDRLKEILQEVEMEPLCRIAFRLMEEEDRATLQAQTVTITNEEGQSVSETLGGVRLLRCLVMGLDEKLAIYRAVMATIGLSRPAMEKLGAGALYRGVSQDPEPGSKKKKTGRRSSTSSARSTAGRRRRS